MDRADLAYLRAVCDTLPPPAAQEVLAAMAAFRNDVRRIRRETRDRWVTIYERYGRTYGELDPIDTYLAPSTGLTHADETRIAAVADGARAEIEALRATANRTSTARLDSAHIGALIEAKRRRRTAFEAAVRIAFETDIEAAADSKPRWSANTVADLSGVADGWY